MEKKTKILILGVSAPQFDAIKELKNIGYEVHAIAQTNDGPGAEIADYFEPINFMDTDVVVEYCKKNKIDVVYSVGSDMAIPQSSKLSDILGTKKFVTEEVARICNNKNLMRETLGENFEGSLKFQVVSSLDDELKIKFPFIVKPSDSQGQRGIAVVNNKVEYKKAFNNAIKYSRSKKVILEQYVVGPEISVNAYMVDGNIKFMFASDRVTWKKYFGLINKHVLPCDSLNNESEEKLRKIIENAANKIGITNGPLYAQVIVENNEPHIIEVTPRLDGCHMCLLLDRYTNVNLIRLTFNHLINNDTSELDNLRVSDKGCVLEFICQEPHTKATYKGYEDKLKNNDSFCYYKEGAMIRPINNKYEKIGYFIYDK